MPRPAWQIEVPMTYLTPEEREEIVEKSSTPLDPEAALEIEEEVAEIFDIEVAIRVRELHLAGVRITMEIARMIDNNVKGNEDE